jgi:siderophore synthetase component
MKQVIMDDLCKHFRDKTLKHIEDLQDTCDRISNDETESHCAMAYIVIRTMFSIASALCLKHGSTKAEFMEIVSGFWDKMEKAHRKEYRDVR